MNVKFHQNQLKKSAKLNVFEKSKFFFRVFVKIDQIEKLKRKIQPKDKLIKVVEQEKY